MSSPEHPISRAPAPWNTKSECYWLLITLKKLPDGVYDPLEAGSEECAGEKTGAFKGGLGIILIVRYKDTPVGPYDELMIIPGNFKIPQPADGPPKIPKKALRLARIYVSQRTTVYNGRVNWNIAKHLARFSFSAPPTEAGMSPPKSLTVKVYPAGSKDSDNIGPFFACTLKPWRWVPSIPFNGRYMPLDTTAVQPPLPEAPGFVDAVKELASGPPIDDYDLNSKYETALLVGTNLWRSFQVVAVAPRCRGCWVTLHKAGSDVTGSEHEAAQEAGKYWPQDVKPWSFGAWMEDADIEITAPLEWKI